MAQYRGAVLSPKDLVSLGNEPFKCGLVGMVEDLPSPRKVVNALPQAMAALLPPGLYAGLDLLGRGRTRAAYTLGKALVVKVGFPHHFGEEMEIMQMLPLLSAELLGEGTVATRLVLNTEPLVNMMVPLRFSISARATQHGPVCPEPGDGSWMAGLCHGGHLVPGITLYTAGHHIEQRGSGLYSLPGQLPEHSLL